MRKKIQELAAGRCDTISPMLQFSEERLDIEVLEEQSFTGEFSIESVNEIPMRGIIYSSNPRMECQNPQFQGTKITVLFEFHSEGLIEGDVQKGDFYIICNEGEYDLPFSVRISKAYPDSSQGKIRSIFGFANLARKSSEEAVEVFGNADFLHVFHIREEEESLIYQSLKKKPYRMEQVEEFLVAAKKKQRVTFTIEEAQTEFYGIQEEDRQYVTLKKEEWGYLSIEMSCDAEFIRPVRTVISSLDFVGNRALAEYIILPKKLHAGRNFARLTFESQFEKKYTQLCIMARERETEKNGELREIQRRVAALAEGYIGFRLHRTVTGVWAKQTCTELDLLCSMLPENLWFVLFKAQVLLVNKQRQEAEWILKTFRRNNTQSKTAPIYGYYLYLCTLHDPDPEYVNSLMEAIREIYHQNQDNHLLFWVRLFMDEELNYSQTRKLEAIEEQAARGCDSGILYLEAYYLICKEPYLLHKADLFERKILNWAVKQKALTTELAAQIGRLIPLIRQFHPVWYRILEACYEKLPERELLQEICSTCIRWNCYGSRFIKWYEQGIREELRITGLYEAWMLSAGKRQMEKIPKVITMYFLHHNNLAYRQQAMLYAAVIQHKSSYKSVYQNYLEVIEKFALDQMKEGRIDSNLAVIYEEILTPSMLTEEFVAWLSKVVFIHKMVCGDEKAVRVVVRHYQLRQEQIVPIVNHAAYLNIYGSSYCILLEDAKGNRYRPDEGVSVKPLMDYSPFLKKGLELAKEKLPYLIPYFDSKQIWQTYEEEDLPYLRMLLESEAVSPQYREELRPQLIAYYYDNYTGDTLDEFLESLNLEGLEHKIRGKLMELLVSRGHYEKAYEMLLTYGSENLSAARLVSVICNKIGELQQEQDEFLIGMCRNVFLRGKYNDYILGYMCRYFSGSLKEMAELWKSAKSFDVETFDLEERCLTQFLYTGSYFGHMEEIFRSYDERGGVELLVIAYLSQMSYQYITKDLPVDAYVFRRISEMLEDKEELNETCRLGFLKWCGGGIKLTQIQEAQAEQILAEAVSKEIYFPFYKNLPDVFATKYLYYDKTFLEYRTDAKSHVILSYELWGSGEFMECEMTRMYSGIFVKAFLLFFGESVPYFIKEEQEGEYVITQSGRLQNNDLCTCAEGSRFDLLSDMIASFQMKDDVTLSKRMDEYQKVDALVKENFTVI